MGFKGMQLRRRREKWIDLGFIVQCLEDGGKNEVDQVPNRMYIYVCMYMYRPTQSIIDVHCLIARFQEIVLLFLQYRCNEDQMLKDLILRTGLCGTGLLLNPVGFFISARPKWSSGNFMYQFGTSSQRAQMTGRLFNTLTGRLFNTLIHRVGRIEKEIEWKDGGK